MCQFDFIFVGPITNCTYFWNTINTSEVSLNTNKVSLKKFISVQFSSIQFSSVRRLVILFTHTHIQHIQHTHSLSLNMTNSKSKTDLMMMRPKDQAQLKAMPGNDRCIDCGRISPEWCSVTLSIFVCLECSGQHRSLGTHISFVRSVKMDSWTPQQLASLKAGGNDKCKQFLAEKGGIDMTVLTPHSIKTKYSSPAAELWRQVIKARVNGTKEPTELPELVNKKDTNSNDDNDDDNDDDGNSKKKKHGSIRGGQKTSKKMEGFGSSPHPSELKKTRKKRAKKILGMGAAAVGAIAAVGMAARNRKKAAATSIALSKCV